MAKNGTVNHYLKQGQNEQRSKNLPM